MLAKGKKEWKKSVLLQIANLAGQELSLRAVLVSCCVLIFFIFVLVYFLCMRVVMNSKKILFFFLRDPIKYEISQSNELVTYCSMLFAGSETNWRKVTERIY